MRIQLIIYAQILIIGIVSATTDKLVCYFGSWSVYRPGNGKFDVENIDPFLCTHLIYAFVGITSDGSIRIMDTWNDIDKKAFERFNKLKNINPKLKTLIAVGGWNEGSTTFSQVASQPQLRSNFIQNTIAFLTQFGFDGLDIDWEYPARRGGSSVDKANFATWIREFREAFNPHGYLITAAVSATASTVDISYDVPALSSYLDFINVMTYDLHGEWDGRTGQNSPLYASSLDITAESKELNVDACIQGWLSRGAEPKKLILGVGAYGRSFRLSSSYNHGLGAPTSGPGTAGPYTGQAGMLGYNEIVENINQWTIVWDNEQKVPYGYKEYQWIGFDNPNSVRLKVEFAKALELGGVMVWSVETDDFKGISGSKNPLLNTIRSNLNLEAPVSPSPPTSSTSLTTSTTSTSTTTSTPSSTFECSNAGYFKDPVDCSKFYCCLPHNGGFLKHSFECPNGLVFNEIQFICDYPSNYPC